MLSEILKFIRKYGESTADQIAISTGIGRELVVTALDELERKGRVVKAAVKPASCSGCGCGCSSSACDDGVIFSYRIS